MSRRGNCWDNAPLESFFATLKKDQLRDAPFATRWQARTALFDYIEGFYNTRRLHSGLGYRAPAEVERLATQSPQPQTEDSRRFGLSHATGLLTIT